MSLVCVAGRSTAARRAPARRVAARGAPLATKRSHATAPRRRGRRGSVARGFTRRRRDPPELCPPARQVGCARGCAFCSTGTMKLVRNLTADEILWQVSRGPPPRSPAACAAFVLFPPLPRPKSKGTDGAKCKLPPKRQPSSLGLSLRRCAHKVWLALRTVRESRGALPPLRNVVFMGMGEVRRATDAERACVLSRRGRRVAVSRRATTTSALARSSLSFDKCAEGIRRVCLVRGGVISRTLAPRVTAFVFARGGWSLVAASGRSRSITSGPSRARSAR